MVSTQIETVVLQLREMIMSGEFPPGSHLMEIPLAEQLQVSRTPVRLALGTLASEGLLIHMPQRGFVVRGFSIKEIIDAVDTRAALESLACKIVCEQGLLPEVEKKLEDNLTETQELLKCQPFEADAIPRWCSLNADFHGSIIQSSDNQSLQKCVHDMSTIPLAAPHTIAATASTLPNIAGVVSRSLEMHSLILDALKKRQAERAQYLMREHVYQGREGLRTFLEELQSGNAPPIPRLQLTTAERKRRRR